MEIYSNLEKKRIAMYYITFTRFFRDDEPGLFPPSLAIEGWGLSNSSSLVMRPALASPSRLNDADRDLVSLISVTRHLLE